MYKLSYMLYIIKVLIILREKKITASNFQIVQYFTLKYSFENTIKGNIVKVFSWLADQKLVLYPIVLCCYTSNCESKFL